MNDLKITFLSADWQAIVHWAKVELANKVARLSDTELSHDATQVVRGEIKALRNLLAQPELAAQAQVEGSTDWT